MTVEDASQHLSKSISAVGAAGAACSAFIETYARARQAALEIPDLSMVSEAAKAVLEDHKRYRDVVKLVGGLVSAHSDIDSACEQRYQEFERLLQDDYSEFARHDDYPAEVEAYNRLMNVHFRMDEIRTAQDLASKNVVAIAGSFSSGKSSFLNSLIGGEKVLPTNITATTTIPTFVSHTDENELRITAFNHAGGGMPIDTRTFQLLTHDFETDYRIALKQIVKRVVISTPNLEAWSKVTFIDTPGYTNPNALRQDEQVARSEVSGARFLIWVVDCENGTLPQKDIDFIRQFLYERSHRRRSKNAPIYIVLNKADKKPRGQLHDILDGVAETTKRNDLPCFGLGLYSAHEATWYEHHGKPFTNFLDMANQARRTVSLDREITSVFDGYIKFHEKERDRLQGIGELMSRVQWVLDEENLHHDLERYRGEFDKLREAHDKHAEEARTLQKKFERCTQAFMAAVKSMQTTAP